MRTIVRVVQVSFRPVKLLLLMYVPILRYPNDFLVATNYAICTEKNKRKCDFEKKFTEKEEEEKKAKTEEMSQMQCFISNRHIYRNQQKKERKKKKCRFYH